MTHEQIAQKAQNLLACIQHGLHLHDQQSSAAHLGDRSQYIGLSDIGRALECPRAALCNKLFQSPYPILQKLLTLQRGHWLEYGISHAFTSQGLHTLPQLELSLHYNDVPIKAHFDFVLAWDTTHPAIRTLLRWAELTCRFQPLAHQGIPSVIFQICSTGLYSGEYARGCL